MERNTHPPKRDRSCNSASSYDFGAWVGWYSAHFGPCVGVAALSDDDWVLIHLIEPEDHRGLPVWVCGSHLRLLSEPVFAEPVTLQKKGA
jgi:hypothetical protein